MDDIRFCIYDKYSSGIVCKNCGDCVERNCAQPGYREDEDEDEEN